MTSAQAIDEIRDRYRIALTDADERAVYAQGCAPARTCRYCGKPWNRYCGSRFEGHTRCMVTIEFCLFLVEASEYRRHQREIAAALGVSYKIVRGWDRYGMDERDRRTAERLARRRNEAADRALLVAR